LVQKSVVLFAASGLVMAALIAAIVTSTNTSEAFPKGKDHKEVVFGAISSIQNNEEGKPAWVLSGHWLTNIVNKTRDSFNQTNAAKFDSWMYMAMLDGSAMHKHVISKFSLNDISNQGNVTSYKGTVTVTMKDGPVEQVPVEIKVMNNHVIDISLDATKTNNHFGDTPIYGIIPPKADITKMKSHMGNKTNMSMHTNMSQW
jgi:hypothetical protein